MNISLSINYAYNKWKSHNDIIDPSYIKEILNTTILNIPDLTNIQNVELSLLLTSDEEIRALNTKFRNKNLPTNVLSFPNYNLHYKTLSDFIPKNDYMYLGDVVFAYETILKEVNYESKNILNHFTHLLVHSILHLLGYLHDKQEDYIIMKELEDLILTSFIV